MRAWLARAPLQKKLLGLVLFACAAALLLTATAFLVSDYLRFRHEMVRELTSRVDLVALNSAPALAFGDRRTARENLDVLSGHEDIGVAALYDRQGRQFARYARSEAAPVPVDVPVEVAETVPPQPSYNRIQFHAGYLELSRDILAGGDVIGHMLLRASLSPLRARLLTSIEILAATLLTALAFAGLLALRLQKTITGPVLSLAGTMEKVSRWQDYSLREPASASRDEIGRLVGGFNDMLAQIEIRDRELKNYKNQLERLVDERTAELLKARDEALQANRTKSSFLANMSHEIRTPMNAVLGYTQVLRSDAGLSEQQAKALSAIESAGLHLLDIINDILDLSKVEAGALELRIADFDLRELVEGMAQLFQLRCEQKGLAWRLASNIEPGTLVRGDQSKLRQVLINLLGNAVKFTDSGYVELSVQGDGEDYAFAVADSGAGIPLAQQAFIFDPFHQGESGHQKGGTGLGLALVKRHLELMGSAIALESAPGAGARFRFALCLPPGEMASQQRLPGELGQADRPLAVWVVDDVAGNRDVLCQLLAQVGLAAHDFADAESALAALEREAPDLVFMDIRMPGMDGFAALARIRAEPGLAGIKVVAITASSFERLPEAYLRAGFDGFIPKPFVFGAVCSLITELTGAHFFATPPAASTVAAGEWRLPAALKDQLTQAANQADLSALRALQPALAEFPGVASRVEDFMSRYDVDGMLHFLAEVSHETG
ncbi:MAG: response regulator [Gammaproteobacteria bacterium]|nr:response regulator [Gammaproteobacteria bacterium]